VQSVDKDTLKKDIGENAINQIGYFTKDLNLYDLFEDMGKSAVGKEMDNMGRYLFNHRFGDGHLWWKELANRPREQWLDVLEHLLSDFFTKAGLPYAFDGTMIKNPDLLKLFGGGKNIASHNNWAMINGFQFISGASSLVFSIYDAAKLSRGYASDLALAVDGAFVGLNILGGLVTANPFMIIAAVIKTTTIIRKSQMLLSIYTSSPFDLNTDLDLVVSKMFDVNYSFDMDIFRLFETAKSLDFMYNNKCVSYN